MRNKPSHLRVALKQHAANHPDQADTLFAMAVQLRSNPSTSAIKLAEALLGISDVPEELWRDPLPPGDSGKSLLATAIDRLSAEWTLTDLHRLVALRRVAWSAMQLARVIEKTIDEAARKAE